MTVNRGDNLHQKTPEVTVLDNRGLTVRELRYHRHPNTPTTTDERITRHRFTLAGQLAHSIDPRLFDLQQTDNTVNPNMVYETALTGEVVRIRSVDAGNTLMLNDITGRPVLAINATEVTRTWQYEHETLPGRPLSITEQPADEAARITERFVWAGNSQAEKNSNLAGQCVRHYDTAGLNQTDSITLNGVPLSVTRQLLPDGTDADWQGDNESAWNDRLAPESFITLSTADATGAVLTTTDAAGNLQRVAYDVAGLLTGSWLRLAGGTEQVIVKSLAYSAAGQKLREEHGNGVVTTYTYEPETQRLVGIKTERPPGHAQGAKVLQDLRYEYDPVGNVVKVTNDAEVTRFWRNQKVVPENTYVYDSLYQLVSATGREMGNIGQQSTLLPTPSLIDSSTYSNYSRTYNYDRGDNLTQIRHSAPASDNSYTTKMTVSNRSNRAVLSTLTENPAEVDALFTTGGQQNQLLPGQDLVWTPRGELLKVAPVVRDRQVSDQEFYRYDADSQRIIKTHVQQTANSSQTQSTLYLPGLERHTTTNGTTVKEVLHVITIGEAGRAQVRVLHWENEKPGAISNDQVRYSYDNLIGSSGLEVDGDGQIISMEEYYPYGGTAILAARSQTEADYKTTRYSGKERDTTGLYYYGYRYYQPWAGRWLSADPAGTVDGLNLFRMVRNNPVSGYDNVGLVWTPVTKAVGSGILGAATLGYEAYKHSKSKNEPVQLSSNTLGNNKIHEFHKAVTDKNNKFSVTEEVKENLSGRGKVIKNFLTKGEVPAHDSIMNQKENLITIAKYSQNGDVSKLDKGKLAIASVSDASNNLPIRIYQAYKGFRTATSVTPEGVDEVMESVATAKDNVKSTLNVGIGVGVIGNSLLSVAKVFVPGAAIPITAGQALWAVSSVGKTVNQVNKAVKENIEKSPISHEFKEELFRQMGKPTNKDG
ncbi:RHS repeat domain-containing protein [Xenorhabdus bovienii]|uniref:RHS repeat domain-containing protein n=4 Tax=Xenorhabdus bovienii TaxID=40576 RepID=UPI00237CA7EE|nr:RHS repeat domain-containing protein [Xenorhabdus bovienii]MDE1483003.1 RHS repeat protein [Xenorhabdus bovienii]